MKRFLKNLGFSKVNGILADLGVSSFQINTPKEDFHIDIMLALT